MHGASSTVCSSQHVAVFRNGVAKLILSGRAKKIVVLTGAGVSVSAGIPDFRTPGTGLYDNLQRYGLGRPEDIFTMSVFREDPHPFFHLSRAMYPGRHFPTPAHFLTRLLAERGILRRLYTQVRGNCGNMRADMPTLACSSLSGYMKLVPWSARRTSTRLTGLLACPPRS